MSYRQRRAKMFRHGKTPHDHHPHSHRHRHGAVDPAIATTARGMWALKWSFLGLLVTAFLQMAVVWLSSSVALLADTIHNVADACTAYRCGWPLRWPAGHLENASPTAMALSPEEEAPEELIRRGGQFAALRELEATGWDWQTDGRAVSDHGGLPCKDQCISPLFLG
jgi:hypothetical protein